MNKKNQKEYEKFYNEQMSILNSHASRIFQRIINKFFELEGGKLK